VVGEVKGSGRESKDVGSLLGLSKPERLSVVGCLRWCVDLFGEWPNRKVGHGGLLRVKGRETREEEESELDFVPPRKLQTTTPEESNNLLLTLHLDPGAIGLEQMVSSPLSRSKKPAPEALEAHNVSFLPPSPRPFPVYLRSNDLPSISLNQLYTQLGPDSSTSLHFDSPPSPAGCSSPVSFPNTLGPRSAASFADGWIV